MGKVGGAALRDVLSGMGIAAEVDDAGAVVVVDARAAWLHDAWRSLGVDTTFAAGRMHLPEGMPMPRLTALAMVALRPHALLLDLDGVLADIERRRAIATVAQVARLAATLPLAVVTTCPRRLAESVLERHGFAQHIAAVIGFEDATPKPDPAPVHAALQRLGAACCWFVGDNPSDVRCAVGAKAVPLAIEPHGIGAEAHAAALRKAGAARLVADLDVVAGLLAG
ncbi:MAG: HAD-IA family hydrolase [Planctomycetes bacterium]|nr:HAD-IA family hydrolase [Planctomycetota bacterium]